MLRRLAPELDHQAHAVFGLGGEDHRSKSYQGGRFQAPARSAAGSRLQPAACRVPLMDVGGLATAADVAQRRGRRTRRRAPRDRHRVHVRGPLPGAAVPGPGGGRQPRPARRAADLPDRLARATSTSARWPSCWPTPRSRSCCTPAARTWRSCAAPGTPSSTTSSTPRSPPASPAAAPRPATATCSARCSGRRVGKTASYTRWDARPLTAEQLGYAAEDVAHLLQLADEIQRRLTDSGRLEWAREECRRLESATDERDPSTAWERLPRVGQLDPARARGRPRAGGLARAHRRPSRTARWARSSPTRRWSSWPSAIPSTLSGPGADPRPAPADDQAPRAGHPRRDRPRPRGPADPARRGAGALGARRRAADRAGRGAAARPRAGGGPGLRADRVARRARADRRRRPARRARARRAHADRLAARAGRR